VATIIDGKAVAARVRAEVAAGVSALVAETRGPPGLATVLVGEDPASAIYIALPLFGAYLVFLRRDVAGD